MPYIDGHQIDVLFSEEQIAQRNNAIAAEIAASNPDRLLILPILKGSFVFAADLIRALHKVGVVSSVEFITVSSYGENKIAGNIRLVHDIDSDIAGRDVLLIDDILESGNTLQFVSDLVQKHGAKSSKIAVLLDKHMRRKAKINADYVGFQCPDEFVVGYGMDVAHAYRQLPFVGIVKSEK